MGAGLEALRRVLHKSRDVAKDGFSISSEQQRTITTFTNAHTAHIQTGYAYDPDAQEFVFRFGQNEFRTSDPDIAAAAIGAIQSQK